MSDRTASTLSKAGRAHAPVFAALGDETRLALLAKLCERSPQSIAQLTQGSRLTRQAISKHLAVLENVGLVESVRVGRECHYELDRKPIDQVRTYLEEVSRQWDEALGRLKAFVERER
jgi:DNA-binding transcriptional ArsR family regulator